MSDDPPRYMGEGFVLMSTNDTELYFYMDEPGLVPEEPVLVTLANGDIVESSPPQWGVDIKCGKGLLQTGLELKTYEARTEIDVCQTRMPSVLQIVKLTLSK